MNRTSGWILRILLPAALLLVSPAGGAMVREEPASRDHAILINVTEQDLNRILVDSFRSNGGPRFEGHKAEVSRGVSELRFAADLSDPVLALGGNGEARLSFEIRWADLTIGQLERKIAGRRARCENAGMSVEPHNPVPVQLDLRFAIEDGDLRVIPEEVLFADGGQGLRLVKPTRCRHYLFPKWLLWWLGKPALKRHLTRLDGVLLERARESASELTEDGLLRRLWEFDEDRLEVYPVSLDTSHHNLFVGLASASPIDGARPSGSLAWVPSVADRSFIGISESFMKTVMELSFRSASTRERRPGGDLDRLLGSDQILTLIPGLRSIENREGLYVTFGFREAPHVGFGGIGDPALADDGAQRTRAVIRLELSGIGMNFWQPAETEDVLLGTLEIDTARVGLMPFLNVGGGISFEIVENDWSVSSRGMEFNESLLAATLQEMLFGEVFETHYRPLARDAFHLGESGFQPVYFNLIEDYLVVEMAGF